MTMKIEMKEGGGIEIETEIETTVASIYAMHAPLSMYLPSSTNFSFNRLPFLKAKLLFHNPINNRNNKPGTAELITILYSYHTTMCPIPVKKNNHRIP